jgi:hypothetical protein
MVPAGVILMAVFLCYHAKWSLFILSQKKPFALQHHFPTTRYGGLLVLSERMTSPQKHSK